MAIEGKKIATQARTALFYSIRTIYRSSRDHPFLACALLLLLILSRSSPTLFAFFVSSSPIIAVTTVLLALLLSYGERHAPENQQSSSIQQLSSHKSTTPADDVVVANTVSAADARVVTASSHDEEDELLEERRALDMGSVQTREFYPERQGEGEEEVGGDVFDGAKDLKVKINKPVPEDSRFDSSLGSPWERIDIHDASLGSESSSPEVVPMLDELHPLLDAEAPEVQAHGGDVEWSIEEQKNDMELGVSDMEMNQRLESLLASRGSSEDMGLSTEKNLIDFDSVPDVGGLSGLQGGIPPISTTRIPFDLPYDSEGTTGLPPVPGSAPSVLFPRQNMFDRSYNQVGQIGSLTTDNLSSVVESSSVARQDILFRMHETFNQEATFEFEKKQESKLKSDSAAEDVGNVEFVTLQRQFSEKSDSKMSTAAECGTDSSVVDQELHEELAEDEFHQESKLSSNASHESENFGDVRGTDLNASMVAEETRLTADASRAVEDGIGEGTLNLSNLEPRGDFSNDCSGSSHSLMTDSSFPNMLEEGVIDSQVANTAYGSSPSAIGKSDAIETISDEPLLDEGTEVLNSSSSSPPYTQEVCEPASSAKPLEMDSSSGENGSELMEATGVRERGIIEPELSRDHEDFSKPTSEPIMHTPMLLPSETESSDLIDVAASTQPEENEKIAAVASYSDTLELSEHLMPSESGIAYPSTEKSAIQLSSEVEESHIAYSSLPSILEENVEELKFSEEHESVILGLTGSQVMEESTGELSDIEQVLSPSQRLSTEEKDADNASRQVDNLESFDASDVSTTVSSNLQDLNKTEAQKNQESELPEILNDFDEEPYKVYDEIRAVEEVDLGLLSELDAVGGFRTEVKYDQVSPTQMLQSESEFIASNADPFISTESSHSTIQEEVSVARSFEANSTDLDETQAVMSMMESEVGSSSQILEETPEMTVYNPKLHVLEACSFEELDSAFKQFHEGVVMPSGSEPAVEESLDAESGLVSTKWDVEYPTVAAADSEMQVLDASSLEELDSVFNQLNKEALLPSDLEPFVENSVREETETGLVTPPKDPKLTEMASELQVLEASSFQELDSAFKQLREGALLAGSEPIVEKAEIAEAEVECKELDTASGEPKLLERDSELQVLESESIEDVNSVFKQPSEGGAVKSTLEVEASDNFISGAHFEPTSPASDLHIVEANSLEDIQLALKQFTGGTTVTLPLEPKVGFAEAEESEQHLEPEVLNVQSVEETHLASVEVVARETGPSHGEGDEKTGES